MSNQAAVAGVLNSLFKAGIKESAEFAGSHEVVYTRFAKRLALVGLVLVTIAAVCIVFFVAKPPERIMVASCFGFFVLLILILVVEFFGARITFDDQYIYTRSAWRPRRKIPFAAVRACDYSETNNWYRIHTVGYGIVRLSTMKRGIAEFLDKLPCQHPVYPPMDANGRLLSGINLTVEDVADLPATPPKRTP